MSVKVQCLRKAPGAPWRRGLAIGLATLGLGTGVAYAQGSRDGRYEGYRDGGYDRDGRYERNRRYEGSREGRYDGRRRTSSAVKPVLAIVSLSDQRISLYDADGKVQESPVSSGSSGYETPAGIFSVVQKKEDHRSNLYDDGEMPFMQRLTWTGIALHAGNLPGHPASHGCVRLPMSFAQRLYDMTELGMRVLIVRDDMAPSAISHPALLKGRPVPRELALAAPQGGRVAALAADGEVVPGSPRHLQVLQALATAKAAEVEPATRRQRETRAVAARAASEASGSARALKAAEAEASRAEAALKDAERRSESVAASPQAQERAAAVRAKAQARVAEVQTRLQAAGQQAEAKRAAAEAAEVEAKAAAAARDRLAQEAEAAERRTFPVSVFVSRKTQRLYVRKGNYPIFEAPVTIRNAETPIGTFVFTAVDPGAAGDMRWTVVSMYPNPTRIEPAPERRSNRPRNGRAVPTDAGAAAAALDRIAMTEEARDLVSDVVLPGSSLIVSDEGPSREVGKDTDFVVVMSGEPQGALKIRQREPRPVDEFDTPPWARGSKSPFGGSGPFFWKW